MSELKLKSDIRSIDRGGQLIARAGDVVDFLSDEGGYVIAQTKNGSVSFPLEAFEYEQVSAGPLRKEVRINTKKNVRINRSRATGYINPDRKLQVGYYFPTQNFKNIPEHTAVFFEDTMELVAVTGPIRDAEAEAYARLFAQAPGLDQAKTELLEVLKEAEITLSQKWNLEALKFKDHDRQTAREKPHIFGNLLDQYNQPAFPTATVLVAVRNALLKHGAK